jgi:hypothetical protein
VFRTRLSAALAVVALGSSAALAQLTIVPTYDTTITTNANSGQIQATINQAVAWYNTNISTSAPVTVNLTFRADESIGLGQSLTFNFDLDYVTFRANLAARATTANDATALASLPIQTNNPVNNTPFVQLTTAQGRALGINVNPPPGQPDSTISLKTSLMNLQHGVVTNSANYDLYAVASHEINEALALGSRLDQVNQGTASATTDSVKALDLFRYDGALNGTRSYSSSSSTISHFSINGTTSIARFNQNALGDYGDWHGINGPMVQNAFGTPGVSLDNGVAEVTALDVMGYTPVPEPGTMVGVTVLALTVGWRRMSRRAA